MKVRVKEGVVLETYRIVTRMQLEKFLPRLLSITDFQFDGRFSKEDMDLSQPGFYTQMVVDPGSGPMGVGVHSLRGMRGSGRLLSKEQIACGELPREVLVSEGCTTLCFRSYTIEMLLNYCSQGFSGNLFLYSVSHRVATKLHVARDIEQSFVEVLAGEIKLVELCEDFFDTKLRQVQKYSVPVPISMGGGLRHNLSRLRVGR